MHNDVGGFECHGGFLILSSVSKCVTVRKRVESTCQTCATFHGHGYQRKSTNSIVRLVAFLGIYVSSNMITAFPAHYLDVVDNAHRRG